jgi:hypothetical protein
MAAKRQAVKCIGKRRDGTSCSAYAINGGSVCWAHGGQLPRVKAKAQANLTEDKARALLARIDVAPVTDPLTALAEVTGQVMAWKDVMAEKVNALSSLRYEAMGENGTGEQLRAEVALWERALDRCEKFLVSMARLRIDDRLARITEQQAKLIETAVVAALTEAGLDLETREQARRSVGAHLRAVS